MRKIYTGIDIGSDSIKIIVSEFFKDKFYVLASTSVRSVGIKKGIIVDIDMAVNSLKLAIDEIEKSIGVRIDKAIVSIPSRDCNTYIVSGHAKISSKTGRVSGEDIVDALEDATIDKIPEKEELVSVIPIVFNVDNKKNIIDPKGMEAEYIEVKAVLITSLKKYIYAVYMLLQKCDIEVADITLGTIGDYHENETKSTTSSVGAVVNIGSDTLTISVFNKGILIKTETLKSGSKFIDRDISYVYNTDLATSRNLKEKFAVCNRRFADINDVLELKNKDGEKVIVNQYEISEIVESRIMELLKLAKKEINVLTNRKISYIIITGGISELTGFSYVAENIFGINAITMNITTVGIRSNKYSTASGIIKYLHKKFELRGRSYSMFNDNQINKLMNNKKTKCQIN